MCSSIVFFILLNLHFLARIWRDQCNDEIFAYVKVLCVATEVVKSLFWEIVDTTILMCIVECLSLC